MILHVVLYQPKASATPDELQALAEAIERASKSIPAIRQARVGRAKDFGFGYKTWPYDQQSGFIALFEFDDEIGLGQYLAHEAHKVLAQMFWKTCDNPIILDVAAVDPTEARLDRLYDLMSGSSQQ